MRCLHYVIQIERADCDWVKRYAHYHGFEDREALLSAGAAEVEQFLTSLAVQRQVVVAMQNQALNALVFLFKRVLERPLEGCIDAVQTRREPRIPVVLTCVCGCRALVLATSW